MAPIFKYAIGALCVFAACPTFAAPVPGSLALAKRQLAGVGAASDSIFTDTDNGVGYGVENAEDNTAKTISTVTSKVPGARRQLDKIANGAGAVASAAGAGQVGGQVAGELDTVDGDSTGDAAELGAQAGSLEETTLENAGSDAP